MTRSPTIYEALRERLAREPSNAELKAEVQRIKDEAMAEIAARGGPLQHRRKRR